MKTSTSMRLAAVGVMGLATFASAQSVCAINCFTEVITDHPPLDCKEANMYLCFCKMPSLQNYFLTCVYDDCGSAADAAVDFGVNLCAEYGVDIKVPERPATTKAEETKAEETKAPASTKAEEPAVQTTAEEAEETKAAEETKVEETKAAEETKVEETKAAEETKAVETDAAAATTKAEAPKETKTLVSEPTHHDNTTSTIPTAVIVNAAGSNAVSGMAAVGIAMAAYQLL